MRELEHAIHHAVVLAKGEEIDLQHLPQDICGPGLAGPAERDEFRPMVAAVADFEREYVLRAMRAAVGKKTLAAALLGISRKTLWERLRVMGHDAGTTDPGHTDPSIGLPDADGEETTPGRTSG